ncbi:MAG: hypothetical protein WDO24_23035 [Pseudomonadota bacterium]
MMSSRDKDRSQPAPDRATDPATSKADHRAAHHARLAQSTDRPAGEGSGRQRNAKARTHKTRRYTGG